MEKKKASVFKNVIVLLAVTFVAVLLLAVVNQITLEPIAAAEEAARQQVYKSVYTDAASFEDVENFDTLYGNMKQNPNCVINTALYAKDDAGNTIGCVVDATSKSGYGGEVQIALGITNEGTITAFSVVSHSETPGLGSKSTEPLFADQFAGMPAEQIVFTKTGKSAPNEIDAISGATITTTAVTEAVNEAITFYNALTEGGLE